MKYRNDLQPKMQEDVKRKKSVEVFLVTPDNAPELITEVNDL
jgi:hypothetical protein